MTEYVDKDFYEDVKDENRRLNDLVDMHEEEQTKQLDELSRLEHVIAEKNQIIRKLREELFTLDRVKNAAVLARHRIILWLNQHGYHESLIYALDQLEEALGDELSKE